MVVLLNEVVEKFSVNFKPTFVEKLLLPGRERIMKRFVFHLIFALLIINALAIVWFNVKPSKGTWTGTVYIRADGSIDPPDAPVTTYNKTYTLIDNITSSGDGIVVERDNIIIDGAGYTIRGEGYPEKGIYVYEKSNLTIRNIIIESFDYGVYLRYSENCDVSSNIISSKYLGILLWQSDSNNISRNTITFGCTTSIRVLDSDSNYIFENMLLGASSFGIELYGYSSDNLLRGNMITNNDVGILVQGGSYNSAFRNIITDNDVGIKLCTYYRPPPSPPTPNYPSYNIIFSNEITSNKYYGIQFDGAENNIISNNTISANRYNGIILRSAWDNNFTGNCLKNNDLGVKLDSNCYGNIFIGNTFASNHIGISFSSGENWFYHNNFVSNIYQINPDISSRNYWDNSYPSGGNYWSDYNGTDMFSGLYQNETGNDGIGDAPYIINSQNRDNYPLMYPHDNIPPEISEPLQQPPLNEIQPFQEARVWVNVTDFEMGIKNVTLWYSIDNGTKWTIVNMTAYREIYEALWGGTIPGYEYCTWVTYKVVAYDNAGNKATKDNFGYYYKYHVIPEFPSTIPTLTTLILATLITIWKAKRKHQITHFSISRR